MGRPPKAFHSPDFTFYLFAGNIVPLLYLDQLLKTVMSLDCERSRVKRGELAELALLHWAREL